MWQRSGLLVGGTSPNAAPRYMPVSELVHAIYRHIAAIGKAFMSMLFACLGSVAIFI